MSELLTFRTIKDKNYKTINLEIYDNNELSLKAKGLHTYIISRPDNWKIWKTDIKNRCSDSMTSIENAMDELFKHGYLYRGYKIRTGKDNKGKEWIYFTFEKQTKIEDAKTEIEKTEYKFYEMKIQVGGIQPLENQVLEEKVYSNENDNIKNNNKDISKDIISDSVESDKNTLKNSLESNIKNHISKEKKEKPKLSYKKIDIFLKRLLNELWNVLTILHPKMKKENFFNESELYDCQTYLNAFRKGLSITKYPFIFEETFYKNNNIPIEKIKTGLSDNEIYKLFKSMLNIYRLGYFPFNDKSDLPSRLSKLFLCDRASTRSFILKYGFNPPKYDETRIKIINDEHPNETKKIIHNFFPTYNFTNKEMNCLINFIKELYNETRFLMEQSILCKYNNKKYTRAEIDYGHFQSRIINFPEFIDCFVCYLNEKKENWNNFGAYIKIFKKEGYFWEGFKTWMEEGDCPVREIDLSWYMNRKIDEMVKSGELVIPEKTKDEQIIELQKLINDSSEGSANRDMFTEKLNLLQGVLS